MPAAESFNHNEPCTSHEARDRSHLPYASFDRSAQMLAHTRALGLRWPAQWGRSSPARAATEGRPSTAPLVVPDALDTPKAIAACRAAAIAAVAAGTMDPKVGTTLSAMLERQLRPLRPRTSRSGWPRSRTAAARTARHNARASLASHQQGPEPGTRFGPQRIGSPSRRDDRAGHQRRRKEPPCLTSPAACARSRSQRTTNCASATGAAAAPIAPPDVASLWSSCTSPTVPVAAGALHLVPGAARGADLIAARDRLVS